MTLSQELSIFSVFPDLPTEIRLKIWTIILPGPRTIAIQYKTKTSNYNGKDVSVFTGWISPDPPPIALSICQESRSEALKHYQTAFGSHFHFSRIYIDYSIDTVRFGNGFGEIYCADRYSPLHMKWVDSGASDCLLDIFLGGGYHGADDAEKIESMIIDIADTMYDRRGFCWDEIRLFTGLKHLAMLSWESDLVSGDFEACKTVYKGTLLEMSKAHPEWVLPEITLLSARGGGNVIEPLILDDV